MKRRLLSLFVAFAMTVSMVVVGAGAVEPTYGDTAGHWAESSIERWSGHGIIQGSNGQFDPNGPLTCAQLATILAKLLKLPAAKDAGFTDNTADAWYYDAINRCAAAGILNGNGDGTVTPEAPITRERAMVMLGRALGIKPIEKPDLTKFSDAAKVASYAQGYVAALIEAGIVGGVTADELAPQDNITRASTVTILDRAISTYADEAGATVKVEGKGIVLVVADDVTITGDVEQLIVSADDIEVTIRGCKDIDSIIVTGENSKVILDNSSANDVTLDSKNTEIETKGNSKVDTVNVSEDAAGATVNAGSGTSIGSVENKAEDTTVTGNGTVKEVASDTDITVETKNTNVENSGDEKITVTDAKGKDSTVSATGSGSSTTVNKETTSSGGGGYSHSHSYDATTHKCSCGQFAPEVVATIGNEKGCLTLAEAVAAVEDNGTITLLKSSTGSGIGTYNAPEKDKDGNDQIGAKGFTIDFNNHTYSVSTPAVGSTTYESQGFHLEWNGADNIPNITLKNGTLNVAEQHDENLQLLIQNYCNLTLDNMTVDGTNLERKYGSGESAYTYVMSNNCGTVVIKDTTITAYNGSFAFDVYGGFRLYSDVTVTVEGSSVINGKIEVARGSGVQNVNSLIITGGTFNGELSVTPNEKTKVSIYGGTFSTDPSAYVADGYAAKENGNDTWTVVEKADAGFVAQVGGVKYTTLAAAIDAAQSGDTVTLLADVTVDSTISVDETLTIDLNGHNITGESGEYGCRVFWVAGGGNLTLKGNGTITTAETNGGSFSDNSSVIRVGDDATDKSAELTVGNGVTVNAPASYGITVFGKNTSEKLTVYGKVNSAKTAAISGNGSSGLCETNIIIEDNAEITSTADAAIYHPQAGSLTVKKAKITGMTGIECKSGNTTIEVEGATVTATGSVSHEKNNNGTSTKGYAIAVVENAGYKGGATATISGGTYTGLVAVVKDDNTVENPGKISITGGTFSSDPSDYLAARYKATKDETTNLWTVREMNWDEYPENGTLMPSGVVITDNGTSDANNHFTITLEDKEAFLYFTQQFDRYAAFEKRKENWRSEDFTKYPSEYNMADLNMWYGPYCSRITVKLGCDVDLDGKEIKPFGMSGYVFNFDGNGHTISNAKVTEANGNSDTNVGFFQSHANVSNVVFDRIQVTAADCGSAGVVAGSPHSFITNVTVKNCSVTGAKYTGAIAGYDYGDITNCKVDNTVVSGQYKVGGIVGYVCTDNEEQQRNITGNTLTNVTVKGENLWSGKADFVIGKIVGNWNAITGTCTGNIFDGATDPNGAIGEIESRCTNVVTSQQTT